jgi:hypothetical protein
MESIVMAAIKTSPVTVSTVLKPGRHKDIIAHLTRHGFNAAAVGPGNQGFVTSEGRFVDRREAKEIALAAGQISDIYGDELHSEHVW